MENFEEESEIRQKATQFECKKIGVRHTKDGIVFYLSIHPNDVPHDFIVDPLGTRYVAALVRLNDHDEPVASPDQEDGQRAVKLAAALCGDNDFQMWLAFNGLVEEIGEVQAAEAMRKLLGIKSRAELKTNQQARQKLLAVRGDFVRDMRSR